MRAILQNAFREYVDNDREKRLAEMMNKNSIFILLYY